MGRSSVTRADQEPFWVKGTLDNMGTTMRKGGTEDHQRLALTQELGLPRQ